MVFFEKILEFKYLILLKYVIYYINREKVLDKNLEYMLLFSLIF